MNTAVAISGKKQSLADVAGVLETMKPQFAAALPQHIKPERMMRVALTAIQNTPKLLDCNRNSFYLAVMRAAQLGLEPDGILGQAYLIPYGNDVQLIVGYKGLIDLARRSGEVSNIIAKEVCKNDEFTVDFAEEIPFAHKPKLDGDRGEVTHFWALAKFKDGGFHWDYMTKAEVITIRDGSSGWQYAKSKGKTATSPWEKNFIEMGKKTVIRRIAKYLPMSVQRASIVEDLVDAGKKFSTNDFGDVILDDDQDVIDSNADETKDAGGESRLDNFAASAKKPTKNTADEKKDAEKTRPLLGTIEIPLDAMKRPMWTPYKADLVKAIGGIVSEEQLMEFQQANQEGSSKMKDLAPTIFQEYVEAASKKYASFQRAA